MGKEIKLNNTKSDVGTMSDNIHFTNCFGSYRTMSGNIYGYDSKPTVITSMSGIVDLVKCKCDKVETMSGNMFLENCIIKEAICMSGTVNLNGTTITKLNAYNISGNGDIITLELPKIKTNDNTTQLVFKDTTFNLFNPLTWFVNKINKQINKQVQCSNPTFTVPDNIRIKNIITDGKVYSKYMINIIGNGELILQR